MADSPDLASSLDFEIRTGASASPDHLVSGLDPHGHRFGVGAEERLAEDGEPVPEPEGAGWDARAFRDADPVERQRIWRSLSAEERQALLAGESEKVAPSGAAVEGPALDDRALRRLHSQAQALHENPGVLSEEARDELAGLMATIDRSPSSSAAYRQAVEAAGRLVQQAARLSSGSYFAGERSDLQTAARAHEVYREAKERRAAGGSRGAAGTWGDPATATPEEFASWSPQDRYTFAKQHREQVRRLRSVESLGLSRGTPDGRRGGTYSVGGPRGAA